ncbi:hypothetical protein F0562_021782 [Nyssa sinensis]|uniref:Uncharacterized protein n=1 Tax=Nyssa sinensis TaxID=561372 RepID=A0A5J5BS65_9ASTE|nr:hypothetical protein F0562_021782 [Nyssa sinensis]
MARVHILSFTVLLALLLVELTVSADPPEISPSPAPQLGGDFPSPLASPPDAGAPSSPSPSVEFTSPPAPPPSDLAPGSSPTPSPSNTSPAPAPTISSNIKSGVDADAEKLSGSGGLKGGQKFGIAFGVIVGACLVVLGGVVYKKRKQNMRRSQYGYAARREIL